MSEEKARLEAIKERVLNATPGPWLERIDEDYYQGGLYLGVSPYHYCRHPDNPNGKDGDGRPWGKHSGLDEDGKTEYFNEDICRIESENEGDVEFLKHAVEDMRWLLSMLGGLDEV